MAKWPQSVQGRAGETLFDFSAQLSRNELTSAGRTLADPPGRNDCSYARRKANQSTEEWYQSVRDVPLYGLSVKDLCIACRQELFLDYIVPIAIQRLKNDVLTGDMYDGELLNAVSDITPRFWQVHAGIVLEVIDAARHGLESDDEEILQLCNRVIVGMSSYQGGQTGDKCVS